MGRDWKTWRNFRNSSKSPTILRSCINININPEFWAPFWGLKVRENGLFSVSARILLLCEKKNYFLGFDFVGFEWWNSAWNGLDPWVWVWRISEMVDLAVEFWGFLPIFWLVRGGSVSGLFFFLCHFLPSGSSCFWCSRFREFQGLYVVKFWFFWVKITDSEF